MKVDVELVQLIKKTLSASPSTHYEIADLVKSSPEEADKALQSLAASQKARKTGSGAWIDSEPKDEEDNLTASSSNNSTRRKA